MSRLCATISTVMEDPNVDPNYKFALLYATRETIAVKRIFRPGKIPEEFETKLTERADTCIKALMQAFACDASVRKNAFVLETAHQNRMRDEFEIEIGKYVYTLAYNKVLLENKFVDNITERAIDARADAYNIVCRAFISIALQCVANKRRILASMDPGVYDPVVEKTIAITRFGNILNYYKLRRTLPTDLYEICNNSCPFDQHTRTMHVNRNIRRTAAAICAASCADKIAVIELLRNAVISVGGDIDL